MMISKLYLCFIPKKWWSADNRPEELALWPPAVNDALHTECLVSKGVNLAATRAAYNQACRYVENVVIRRLKESNLDTVSERFNKDSLPAITLDANAYLDLVNVLGECGRSIRLGATIFPPDKVEGHASGFRNLCQEKGYDNQSVVKERLKFFSKAKELECGIVEILSLWQTGVSQSARLPQEVAAPTPVLPVPETLDISLGEKLDMAKVLQAVLKQAETKRGVPWNFSNTAHEVTSEVLHEYVYVNDKGAAKNGSIGVIYADGSQGRPFPLRCLTKLPDNVVEEAKTDSVVLRVALISMRHLSLDREVDLTWLRNVEASQFRKLAETDEECYQLAKKRFKETLGDIIKSEKTGLSIFLYQTGLQPAVIGFYRALTEVILEWRKEEKFLVVVPMFFRAKGHYVQGKIWA